MSLDSIGQPLLVLFPRSRVRIVAVSPSLPPSLSCGFSLLRGAKKADGRMSSEQRVLHGPARQVQQPFLSLNTAPHATRARMHDLLQLLKFHPYRAGLKSGPQVARVFQAS